MTTVIPSLFRGCTPSPSKVGLPQEVHVCTLVASSEYRERGWTFWRSIWDCQSFLSLGFGLKQVRDLYQLHLFHFYQAWGRRRGLIRKSLPLIPTVVKPPFLLDGFIVGCFESVGRGIFSLSPNVGGKDQQGEL